MNKEFKKYFDKKMKDNTNKYVVMYKAILVLGMILFFLILTYEFYNSFKGGAPKKIIEILEITAIMLPFPLYFVQRKIFGKENKTKVISKCKTKKDIIMLKLYNISKIVLFFDTLILLVIICLISNIMELFKCSDFFERVVVYIFMGTIWLFIGTYKYLDKHHIL